MGKYVEMIQIRKSNRLAGLYPITKLWIVFLNMICTFIIGSIKIGQYKLGLGLIPWLLTTFLMSMASGEIKKCIKGFKPVFYIAAIIFVVQLFLIPGTKTVWHFGFLRISDTGLQSAIYLPFMIMNIAGMFVWLFQTTTNKELSRALDQSGMNYKAAYVFTSTLQMIDTLSAESRKIMAAQRARGIETEGKLTVRAKAFVPTIIPLILNSLMGAEERVLTLESRGFNMNGNKTHLFNIEKSGIEGPLLILWIVLTVAAVAGRIIIWRL